jgi:hypothetical protein
MSITSSAGLIGAAGAWAWEENDMPDRRSMSRRDKSLVFIFIEDFVDKRE